MKMEVVPANAEDEVLEAAAEMESEDIFHSRSDIAPMAVQQLRKAYVEHRSI